MRNGKKLSIISITIILLLSLWSVSTFAEDEDAENEEEVESIESTETDETDDEADVEEEVVNTGDTVIFPDKDELHQVAENGGYILKVQKETGHFVVENKETGETLKSFPNPENWDEEKTAASWQSHLQSPFMFTYVEMNERKDQVKESNLLNNESEVDFEEIEDGYKVTYTMPGLGFVIPVEVRLADGYVETKVLADELIDVKVIEEEEEEEENNEEADKKKTEKEDPMARIVSLRLFPFLGADTSDNQNGFILLPDGSGALVDFQQNRASTTNLYSERIYGDDQAFAAKASLSSRLPIRMPIFGIKSEGQAILGVVHEGDAYTNIVSAPSESFSQYNWVTGEHLFRFKVFQATNKQRTTGFYTYSPEMQRTDRVIRYYLIEDEDPDYVDLAETYREYLMEEQGVERITEVSENLKLSLNILGGGTKRGFIWDSYLPLTTTDQAMKIVQELGSLGINDMFVTYLGWQKGGFGKYGGHFPVAKQIGGNKEMKEFSDFVHSKGYPLYLEASSYTYNNTGKDGFRANRDGLRDLTANVMKFRRRLQDATLVSPLVMEKTIYKDFKKAEDLGIDGYLYGDGIGSMLSSDYNDRYPAQRHEVKEIQKTIIEKTKEEFGDTHVTEGNFYTLNDVSHIDQMDSDYSYDLFVDRTIPFAQIALHGLVSYSFDYGNMSGNAQESYLRGIEYGAVPSFLVTYEESHRLLESDSMYRFYSTYYKDWETEIASQYQDYNEALADVQDVFITNHEEIARNVFETTYENGKRIVVNYNEYQHSKDGIVVDAGSFTIIEGGK